MSHLRIGLAVCGVGETLVPDDVPEAGGGEEKCHDPRHPSEREDCCQQSTRAVLVAPIKVSPLCSGDDSTDDP